jgi:N-acetylmuramic acid 6-phosphate etherase
MMSVTESQNPNTLSLDQLSSEDLVKVFLQEDAQVLKALDQAKAEIAKAIDMIYEVFTPWQARIQNLVKADVYDGPTLFYVGAGTSGRLGILDAVECTPTFSTHPNMIQGIIAGGDKAIKEAVEGAEDDEQAGFDFVQNKVKAQDIVLGISASGSTPFVLGALKAAQTTNIPSIAIANNPNSIIFKHCKHYICLETGPEVLSGSTRLKAGSSQKIVLNIISTSLMVKLGKTYSNLMVDVQASNQKLVQRCIRLVMQISQCSEKEARAALEASQMKVKQAVLKILKNLDYEEASRVLAQHKGFLGRVLE